MMSGLTFASPFILIALVSLPALWLVLRVTPPRPKQIPFPPLVIMRQWMGEENAPERIPLWILILRLLIATAVILAMAGPAITPERSHMANTGPLALYIEPDWAIAPNWDLRIKILSALISEAEQAGNPVILVAAGDNTGTADLITPQMALEKLRALKPLSYRPDRTSALEQLRKALIAHPDSDLVIASDGLADHDDMSNFSTLAEIIPAHKIRIMDSAVSQLVAGAGIANSAEGMKIRIIRSPAAGEKSGRLIAYDAKGRSLGETPFRFAATEIDTHALIALPTDLRNEISRVDIAGIASSAAVQLVDDRQKRRRIGLVSGASRDGEQPLLSPAYYLARALEPRADIREPHDGIAQSVLSLLDEHVAILILADIGALPRDAEARVQTYLDQGGMVVRFAGPHLANTETSLLPVRLRGSGRALQGALSWETPQRLSEFERGSPFFGLAIPNDVTVSRQLLAEPDADLAKKTWAALTDGTPIVTAEKRGKGTLILFHVTADTSWSSLPLSGLFLSMFERLLSLTAPDVVEPAGDDQLSSLQPLRILDGFGQLGAPPPTAKPANPLERMPATADHPAGFYGDMTAPFAINSLDATSRLQMLDLSALNAETVPLAEPERRDLMPPLLFFAALLMAIDGLASLIRGRSRKIMSLVRLSSIVGIALILVQFTVSDARAASAISQKDSDAALKTHLAYVLTGDPAIDDISRAGLEGLGQILSERTSFEPAEPIGVDLKVDDLAVYPLLYWPMTETQSVPPQDAIRRIDRFMKNGGTILFDTRDATLSRDGDPTPETMKLRLILAGLSIPPLEPLPQDHVLTKAFYLIDRIVGRTANGQTWLEALPKTKSDGDEPARAGDGVSPVIITSNDLAAAWAIDQRGTPLLPIDASVPRQREMALRGGVNIVMYVLTGNYKADQVHIPALLERLGK